MIQSQRQTEARLAEVIASLSLATDLATGQALEHGLRRALLAVWLAEELDVGEAVRSDVYYVALVGTVGCALEAAAFSPFVKDEIAVGTQLVNVDPTKPVEVAAFFLRKAGEGDAPISRARKVLAVAKQGHAQSVAVCRDVAMQVGEMLDLGPAVREAVGQCHEQWNGKGWPRGLEGEQINLAARLFILAHDVEIIYRLRGREAAIEVARRRSGRLYDPRAAERFCDVAGQLLGRLDSEAAWDAVLAAEPAPRRSLIPDELDEMAETIANFVDSRSVYTLGHSPAVAALARSAARSLGLSESDATAVWRAGLLHDLGRTGVPVAVWDKKGSLDETEWERMRGHPALTELVLARSSALGHLGTLAGLHHERLDGSGYRGVPASFLPVPARILAAADTYQSKLERRPYRRALTPEEAATEVRRMAAAGELDAGIVEAVLGTGGQPAAPPSYEGGAGPASGEAGARNRPAGLSEREVEVLRLAVQGLSNREIAEHLVVSPKTVGHHIERIYDKIGVSTRVGATLFALQHKLISTS